ncbi:MAG: T9SS type A sorting domain-containing protein [Bacteroidota bacterium]
MTGAVDTDLSIPGLYEITHIVPPPNADTNKAFIHLLPVADPSFYYLKDTLCEWDGILLPIITGTTGGTFFSGTGLIIDPVTGAFDANWQNVGSHQICYQTAGPCGRIQCDTVEILPIQPATFNYPYHLMCGSDSSIAPLFLWPGGPSSGTFYADIPGLDLDPMTGIIQPYLSVPDTYQVYHVVPGPCADTHFVLIAIHPEDTAAYLDYGQQPICSGTQLVTPTLVANHPGTFLSTFGLAFQDAQGTISPPFTAPGQYVITYALTTICGEMLTDTVDIIPGPTVSISPNTGAVNVGDTLWALATPSVGVTYQWYSGTMGNLNLVPGAINDWFVVTSDNYYSVEVTDTTVDCATESNTILLMIDAEEAVAVQAEIKMHPNPTNGTVEMAVELRKAGSLQVEVFDPLGRRLEGLTQLFGNGRDFNWTMDFGALPAGVYSVVFNSGDFRIHRKIVRQ